MFTILICPLSYELIVFSMFVLKLQRKIDIKELPETISRFGKDLPKDTNVFDQHNKILHKNLWGACKTIKKRAREANATKSPDSISKEL